MEHLANRVFFRKPDLRLLYRQGFNAVDMHYHSQYSDTRTKISNIVKRAKQLKIGVAITDHNEIRGSIEAHNIAKELMIIPGIEVGCVEGPHILVYFYSFDELTEFYNKYIHVKKNKDPYSLTNLKVAELLDYLQDYNHLVSAAHPYGCPFSFMGMMKCIDKHIIEKKLLDKIHAMEIISGEISRSFNKKALKTASLLEKAITGGTDGHSLFQLGRIVTYSEAGTIDEFLDNIKNNNNFVIGKESGRISKVLPVCKSIEKHIPHIGCFIKMHYNITKERRRVKKEEKAINKFVRKNI